MKIKRKYAFISSALILSTLALTGVSELNSTYAAEKVVDTKNITINNKGLTGYYFVESNFKKHQFMGPTTGSGFSYDTKKVDQVIDPSKQRYRSIQYKGYLKSNETGTYTFETTDDLNSFIMIDGKIVSNHGKKISVDVEKGKKISLLINYTPSNEVNSKTLQGFQLYKVDSSEKKAITFNEFRQIDENYNCKVPQISTRSSEPQSSLDETTSTDSDGIYDKVETEGYVIKDNLIYTWDDSLAEEGYTKYVSNPTKSHTAGDPYSDYEKAANKIPANENKEVRNPLVAAIPIIQVNLENKIISANTDYSNSVSSNVSHGESNNNTIGVSGTVGFASGFFTASVTASYSHSNTISSEWGQTNGSIESFNNASAAYLNANVRYVNSGTGGAYNVSPTTNFVIGSDTIATIQARENKAALSLHAGSSYPEAGEHGIAINTMDDFSSHPITLNKNQMNSLLLNKEPLVLETLQSESDFMKYDWEGSDDGKIIKGGTWSTYIDNVKSTSASIIIDDGQGNVLERYVVGKDYDEVTDKNPEVTLREALKIAYPKQITEKNNELYFNDKLLSEESILAVMDEATKSQVEKEFSDSTGKFKDVNTLFDVKLIPEMKFTLKLADIFSSDLANHNESGNVMDLYVPSSSSAGKYSSMESSSSTIIKNEHANKIKANTKYMMSFTMRAEHNQTSAQVTIPKTDGKNVNVTVDLDTNWKRINIPVSNTDDSQIYNTGINGGSTLRIEKIEGSEFVDIKNFSMVALSPEEIKEKTKEEAGKTPEEKEADSQVEFSKQHNGSHVKFISCIPDTFGGSPFLIEDSERSDDLIYNRDGNHDYQIWIPEYDEESKAFYLKNKNNGYYIFESEGTTSDWNTPKVMTMDGKPAIKERALWRIIKMENVNAKPISDQTDFDKKYVLKNMHSGRYLQIPYTSSGYIENRATVTTIPIDSSDSYYQGDNIFFELKFTQ